MLLIFVTDNWLNDKERFRFHLTMDTLAFGYILPTTGRIRDFNPLETCAARRTTQRNGGSENWAAVSNRRIDRLLYDGFFSFAVVRQDFVIMRCQSPHEAALGERSLPDRPAICYSSFREVSDSLQWTVHSQYRWCHLADELPWCCPKSFGTSGHILSWPMTR